MANTLLTPDDITREALRVLHQKLNFVGNVNRQYDDSFAEEGAKRGDSMRIRRPAEYTTATGATIATGTGADTLEQNFTLTISTQRHVPMRFTSKELTLDLDDFSERVLNPAMARLSAKVEADALSMADSVFNMNTASSTGTLVQLANVLSCRKDLVDNLASNAPWTFLLDTQANADMVNDLKGLFQDSNQIAKQYREGILGVTSGFEFYENTLLPTHISGTEAGLANFSIAGTGQTSADAKSVTITIDGTAGATNTIKKGDVFTIANVNRVHPETKDDSGEAQRFVALEDKTGSGTTDITLKVSPGIVTSGPRQNVSAAPADNATLTFKGPAGNGAKTYKRSLCFDKDAFTFATADLIVPSGLDFASRQVYDGISLRILRDYAIVKDRLYTRCDVLYGYTELYRQLASVIWHQ